MRRSIRWTLLGWYTLILALVIAGFGALLYHHRHRTVYEEIDAELTAHARALADSVEWEEHDGYEYDVTRVYARHFENAGPDDPYFQVWADADTPGLASPGAPDVEWALEPGPQ